MQWRSSGRFSKHGRRAQTFQSSWAQPYRISVFRHVLRNQLWVPRLALMQRPPSNFTSRRNICSEPPNPERRLRPPGHVLSEIQMASRGGLANSTSLLLPQTPLRDFTQFAKANVPNAFSQKTRDVWMQIAAGV